MRSRILAISLLLLIGLVPVIHSPAHAATINVACNTADLIAAINTANGNGVADTLNLASGCVYNFTSAADIDADWGDSALPRITSKIAINGNEATLQRDSTASTDFRLIHVVESGKLTLSDVTITGGQVDPSGGGIFNFFGGTLTVIDSTISGNSASNFGGGGIDNFVGATLTVTNSIISGNYAAANGGGISSDGTMTVTDSTISGNTTGYGSGGIFSGGTAALVTSIVTGNGAGYNNGGGIFNVGTMTVTDSTISDNSAPQSGGGIDNYGTLTVTNSTISGNSAANNGGGIGNGLDGTITVVDSTLSGNSAANRGGGISNSGALMVISSAFTNNYAPEGGGIYNSDRETMLVINSVFSGNTGGIKNRGATTVINSTISGNSYLSIYNDYPGMLTVANSTISGNGASSGGGLYNARFATLTVTNSIVWGNNGTQFLGTGSTTVTHSIVEGGFAGTGNLDVDPLFVAPEPFANAPTTAGDYHLQPTSPAKNAGSNTAVPADSLDLDSDQNTSEPIPFDRDGAKRISDGVVDMGAYEIQVPERVGVGPLGGFLTEGGVTSTYAVVLLSEPTADVIVTPSGDAQCSVSGALTFTTGNWDTSQDVTVAAVDDDIAEGMHTCSITHTVSSTDPNFDGIYADSVEETVTDNDTAGVDLVPFDVTVTEGGATDTYAVVLLSEPTADVTVTPSGDAQCSVSAALTFTPANWDTPQDVTVTAVDDDVAEGAHSCSIAHAVTSGDPNYDGIYADSVQGTVNDNDITDMSVPCDTASLIAAIDTANGNGVPDTLNLASGCVYSFTSAADIDAEWGDSALPRITSAITIYGNGATIQRDSTASTDFRLFNVTELGNLDLRDATISGGYTHDVGGAILSSGIVSVTNSTISSNSGSSGSGGSTYAGAGGIFSSGTLTITGSIISGNGANIWSCAGVFNSGTMTLVDSTLSNNGPAIAFSGGICNHGTLTVTNSAITDNTSENVGGGIYNLGVLTVASSTLSGNRSGLGGAIYNEGGSAMGKTTIFNTSIIGNSASIGGGICGGGKMTVVNSTIAGNSAEPSFGIPYSLGGGIYGGEKMTIINSTIAGNSASSSGGVYFESGTLKVKNSIVWGNGSPIEGTGTLIVTYSLIEGGFAGTGNLNVDPLFVAPEPFANAPTTAGDYHLQANSPAKNAGSNATLPTDMLDLDGNLNTTEPIPFDHDGNKRISGGIVDMGAYEVQLLELLVNGSFEAGIVPWDVTTLGGDKVKDKNPFDGLFAFRFKGFAGKPAAKLKQTILTPPIADGDIVTASAFIRSSLAANGKMTLKIKSDLGAVFKGKVAFDKSGVYTLHQIDVPVTLGVGETVANIKLQFKDKSLSGKVYVDAVSVTVDSPPAPRTATRAPVLPPPAAPDGFRGGN